MQTKKKSEEEILFSEVKIAGYKIKPWSFGTLFDISKSLEVVLDKAEEKGIIKELTESDIFRYTSIGKLFIISADEILKIISITLGVDVEKVKQLSMPEGIKVAVAIFNQNKEIIKNALVPLLTGPKEGEVNTEEKEEK